MRTIQAQISKPANLLSDVDEYQRRDGNDRGYLKNDSVWKQGQFYEPRKREQHGKPDSARDRDGESHHRDAQSHPQCARKDRPICQQRIKDQAWPWHDIVRNFVPNYETVPKPKRRQKTAERELPICQLVQSTCGPLAVRRSTHVTP